MRSCGACCDHALGERGGEGADLLERRAALERHPDVEPARPGGLEEGHEAALLEQVAGRARGALDLGEVVVGRIEVDHQPVGMVDPIGAREPDVEGQAGLVGEVGERRRIARQHVLDLAVLLGDARAADPARKVGAGVLLHEALGPDAVGEALERERAAGEVGQHDRRDPPVVAEQIALGQAGLREQHLGGVRQLDLVAVDLDHLPALRGGGHLEVSRRSAG